MGLHMDKASLDGEPIAKRRLASAWATRQKKQDHRE